MKDLDSSSNKEHILSLLKKKEEGTITIAEKRELKLLPLWLVEPEQYETDINGEFLLKKNGDPKRKRGKRSTSPHTYHSDTKAKIAGRKSIRNKVQTKARLEASLDKAEKSLQRAQNTLGKLDDSKGNKVLTDEDLSLLPDTVRTQLQENESEIAFKANVGPQSDFLAAGEKEVLFGGAAGGGKSYAMLVDPLRFCGFRDARALLIRRTMPELRELIDKSHELYTKAYPGAKFRQQDKTWSFPSGAKLEFGFCEKDADVYRYQGQAYSWIGFDELTQWATDFCWNYLGSRLRTTNPEIQTYLRATANPGGVGGHWVKKRFIDPAPANESFAVSVETPNGKKSITRKFIPALLKDNPYLADTDYSTMLAGLPEVLRKQLLEGNWDVSEGAAFPEFDSTLDNHVIAPFEIPAHWERLKGVDYGYAAESACLWAAVDPEDGTLIFYRELYMKGLTGDKLGAIMAEMELPDIRSVPGVLDWAAWSQAGGGYKGPTVGEVLVNMGHKLRRADKNRKAGKVQFHQRLAKNSSGRPGMQIFSTCPNLIRELQSLPSAKNDPEDVDTHASDHAYDAARYLIMSRPRLEGHMQRMARFKSEEFQASDDVFGY